MDTTIVRLSGGGCFSFGGGGCGTMVGRPVGTLGVMTMKMMISTRSTSIRGTTLGSDTGPSLLPPTAMAMRETPLTVRLFPVVLLVRATRRWRGWGTFVGLNLLGQQTDILHAGRANL